MNQTVERRQARSSAMRTVRGALHDLSQPVTALLCLLELAQMQGGGMNFAEMLGAIRVEAERASMSVKRAQETMQALELEEVRG